MLIAKLTVNEFDATFGFSSEGTCSRTTSASAITRREISSHVTKNSDGIMKIGRCDRITFNETEFFAVLQKCKSNCRKY